MFYAAKCFWPGIDESEFDAIAARATENSSRDARHGAKYLGSLMFTDDELVLCMFEAHSPSAVKRASERAGIPCERVMRSIWLGSQPDACPKRPPVVYGEPDPWRGRLMVAAVIVISLLLASCSSSSRSGSSGGATIRSSAQTPPAAAAPVKLLRPLKSLKQPSARCGAPHTHASLVRFKAADGTGLDGAMLGSGTVGVVLAHEYDNDLCGAWPFANYLAKHGFRAFAFDMRCFGRSACPKNGAAGRVVDDVVAAVAELRRHGVRKVALVGASMGGSAALVAATRVQPPVDAVISLSGEANPTRLLHIPLNALAAVQQLTVPAMFVVADYDQYASVEETRAMYHADKTADKRLVVLSGQFSGFHGWMDLTQASGAFSPTATKVVDFITAHARG